MKIYDNGIIRDMTAEEIAAAQAAELAAQATVPTVTDDDKIRLYIQSIPTAETPTEPPKLGYKWQLLYSGAAGFAWELIPDPDALGTLTRPLQWHGGMAVRTGYHYTDGTATAVALADGVPASFSDSTYFAVV